MFRLFCDSKIPIRTVCIPSELNPKPKPNILLFAELLVTGGGYAIRAQGLGVKALRFQVLGWQELGFSRCRVVASLASLDFLYHSLETWHGSEV